MKEWDVAAPLPRDKQPKQVFPDKATPFTFRTNTDEANGVKLRTGEGLL